MKNEWPFSAWQSLAIRQFHLSPSEFWAMPVSEWLLLIGGLKSFGFDQIQLDDLMKKYPDDGVKNDGN